MRSTPGYEKAFSSAVPCASAHLGHTEIWVCLDPDRDHLFLSVWLFCSTPRCDYRVHVCVNEPHQGRKWTKAQVWKHPQLCNSACFSHNLNLLKKKKKRHRVETTGKAATNKALIWCEIGDIFLGHLQKNKSIANFQHFKSSERREI